MIMHILCVAPIDGAGAESLESKAIAFAGKVAIARAAR